MEQMLIKHIDIEMYQDVVKPGDEGFDFLVSRKCFRLNFELDAHFVQVRLLIIVELLQPDV